MVRQIWWRRRSWWERRGQFPSLLIKMSPPARNSRLTAEHFPFGVLNQAMMSKDSFKSVEHEDFLLYKTRIQYCLQRLAGDESPQEFLGCLVLPNPERPGFTVRWAWDFLGGSQNRPHRSAGEDTFVKFQNKSPVTSGSHHYQKEPTRKLAARPLMKGFNLVFETYHPLTPESKCHSSLNILFDGTQPVAVKILLLKDEEGQR